MIQALQSVTWVCLKTGSPPKKGEKWLASLWFPIKPTPKKATIDQNKTHPLGPDCLATRLWHRSLPLETYQLVRKTNSSACERRVVSVRLAGSCHASSKVTGCPTLKSAANTICLTHDTHILILLVLNTTCLLLAFLHF